ASPALHSFPTRRSSDLFAGNRRRLQGFRQQSLFRSFCGSSNWQGVGCPEFGKNGLAPRAANNVFFPRIHFFGQERALMVRGEHRSEEHTSELQSRSDLV